MSTKTITVQNQLSESKNIFNRIGIWYDLINCLITLGSIRIWHHRVSEILLDRGPLRILDLACGTAEQIISLYKTDVPIISITGIDVSEKMLEIARKKINRLKWKNSAFFIQEDMHSLRFEDSFFDALTLCFGLSYSTDIQKLFNESARVLKPDCPFIIIEFNKPNSFNALHPYTFYINFILPAIGRLISGSRQAYKKIAKTIHTVPDQNVLCSQLKSSGFQKISVYRLFPGIVTLYCAKKGTSLR